MTKTEFISDLQKKLYGLPERDIEERLCFWGEMIDDRIEEGFTEEEAVADIGSTDEIAAQIMKKVPLIRIAHERIRPKRRMRAWEITLLSLTSPIWLSLGIAAFAVLLSLYVVLWSAIISVWAVFASLAACVIGGAVAGIIFTFNGNPLVGIAVIGAGIVCLGLAILLCFGCRAVTKGIVLLTPKITLGIKKCFLRKEKH